MKQNRMIATILHSHGLYNIPPSPQDLIPILLRNHSPMAGVCTFVVTPDTQTLIFRSSETPQYSLPEINENIEKLIYALRKRIATHESPGKQISEHLRLNARVIAALQRDLIKKYKLNVFFGNGKDKELKKIIPDDLPSMFRDLPQNGDLPSSKRE